MKNLKFLFRQKNKSKRPQPKAKIDKNKKSLNCMHCQKSFTQSKGLVIHIRSHTGEKPYFCVHCPKSFSCAKTLRLHTRIHTGEKNYHCSQCLKSFTRSSHLRVHMRVHTGEKPHSCPHCSKSFSQSAVLVGHLRVHTGEKPFPCDQCEKSFALRGDLKKHLRVHSGEKPYSCSLCLSSFSESSTLNKHFRVHTGEKPFKSSVWVNLLLHWQYKRSTSHCRDFFCYMYIFLHPFVIVYIIFHLKNQVTGRSRIWIFFITINFFLFINNKHTMAKPFKWTKEYFLFYRVVDPPSFVIWSGSGSSILGWTPIRIQNLKKLYSWKKCKKMFRSKSAI